MSIRRVVPNITSDRVEESRKFYSDFVGLQVAMDMGWIVTLASPRNSTAQTSLLQASALAAQVREALGCAVSAF